MAAAKLLWETAEVKDATLIVEIEGDRPEGWKESFDATVRLLGGGAWGTVEVEQQAVQVGDVTPGSEEKLRHYLESVVVQANAATGADDEESSPAPADSPPADERGPDAEMIERFRSFGQPDRDPT